jgi:hypothetical protein
MKRAIAFAFFLACTGVLLGDSPDSRSPSLLQDLVRMTKSGMSDVTVLAYAKAHRVELPPELSADDLLWLRKSGASETVVRYMSAIDVRASDASSEDVAYDSDEAPRYSAGHSAADSYSGRDGGDYGDYGGYSNYGSYPDSYDVGYPATYYNDYYPFYAAGYYPYPVYFFVDQGRFFGRFRHGRGFGGRHGRGGGHGGFGRPHSSRGDFDRGLGRHRGSDVTDHRGSGRSNGPRGDFGQGFRGTRADVIRSGGSGRPAFPRDGFGRGSTAPRGAVVRNEGFGRPGFAGGAFGRGSTAPRGTVVHNGGMGRPGFAGGGHAGGSFGRAPIARSGGGGGRAAVGRPAGNGRR